VAKGEVLSQSQIDSLLSALESGQTTAEEMKSKETGAGAVRKYDFKHPAKFSREHTQTLSAIHEVFGRLFSTHLSAQLRLASQIDVVSVDQLTYDEFMRSLASPTVIVVFSMPPLEGNAILELTCNTAIAIIDRLMGGPGRNDGRIRELTDIEQSLILKTIDKGLFNLSEAWKTVINDLNPQVQNLETNPRFVQVVAPSDTVAVVTFELRLGESQGSMRLCIPYPLIEPIIPRMSAQIYYASIKELDKLADEPKDEMKKNLNKIDVRISLVLGYTDITVRDLVNLQVGDVITLNSLANNDLPVIVENDCKYYARPGLVGNRLAAQITTVLSSEG